MQKLRNIAIIAHVDHGKTTLVDKMIVAGHLLRGDNNTGDLIQSLGLDYEDLNPQEILAGKLKDFKVLFLPYSQALSRKEAAAIKEFVRNGGLLIADFTPGIMNEHGKFLDDSLLADVFGSFDKMNIKKYGKGKAILLNFNFAIVETSADKATPFNGFLKDLLVKNGALIPFSQSNS